ncbi:hypothetical protein [Desulfuromonas acetoxidans]|uniref:hypothetical protein n=1 Tax=Desulfuromonas acetoxidans TaxID=891 RepID=UPI00058E6A15|nr:hypothetical protein [Desulfuromonas acetoxidans]MBF0644599.1 hypothetical protein [Desulfuromonas acetoxidans]NVD23794.1 hypothetical protein [Desulfuromonas acetoxidans]NVE15809.1 hypothetical protein [Desulfuromonas acetoxidans]
MATHKTRKDFELKPEDLEGFDIKDIKCHACSGYGNCGYRMYRLLDGKPVLICQLLKQQLIEERDQQGTKASK